MRWVSSQKAALMRQIDDGAITFDEACARYALSAEELTSWRTAVARHGVPGLRATRLQIYGDRPGRRR